MKVRILTLMGLGFLMAGAALASPVPEISPDSAAVPVALIGGALLIVRSRLRR